MSPASSFDPNEADFEVIHPVAAGLYTYVTRFNFDGKAPLQNRSVVVYRRKSSAPAELVIINPVELTAKVLKGLQQLEAETGAKVKSLVSTGDWHYLFMGAYIKAFPGAEAFVCPGRVPAKAPGFPFKLIDTDGPEALPQLQPELRVLSIGGLRDFTVADPEALRHELVFFHPSSGALIAGDLLWFVRGEPEPHHRAMGLQQGILDFHFAKWKMVRNARELQDSLTKVQAWDFKHFISIHGGPGNMLVDRAKEQMASILAWSKSAAPTAGGV